MKRTTQMKNAGTPSIKKGAPPNKALRGVGKPKREWVGGLSGRVKP